MSNKLELVAEGTVEACVPILAIVKLYLELLGAGLSASVSLSLPSLQARLAGLLKAQSQLSIKPPSIAGSVDIATKLLASLNLSVAPPSLSASASIAAVAALVLQIQGIVAQLQALLDLPPTALKISAKIGELIISDGVKLYEYNGTSVGLLAGEAMQTAGLGESDNLRVYLFVCDPSGPGAEAIKYLVSEVKDLV